MKVRCTFLDELLGTACNDPDIHRKFIASKAPDPATIEDEVAALGVAGALDRATTVFPRNAEGLPVLYAYQIKGFLKEAIGVLLDLDLDEIKIGKTKLTKWTHKRIVDNFIGVEPREIVIHGEFDQPRVRPLRALTPQGERVSLVSSECIKAGAIIEFIVKPLSPVLDDVVARALGYGAFKGLGQWRNSGRGSFTWEEVK